MICGKLCQTCTKNLKYQSTNTKFTYRIVQFIHDGTIDIWFCYEWIIVQHCEKDSSWWNLPKITNKIKIPFFILKKNVNENGNKCVKQISKDYKYLRKQTVLKLLYFKHDWSNNCNGNSNWGSVCTLLPILHKLVTWIS